jgi:hypothetical protein
MPIFTWVEDSSSRSATVHRLGRRGQDSYKKSWKIFGSTDDTAVHRDVNAEVTANYLFWQHPNQPDKQLQAESYSLDYLGDEAWQLTVNYAGAGADGDEENPLRRSRSFDTSGGTQHITQAIGSPAERRYAEGDDTAPNQFGAIGVDGNSVQGVDIVTPALQWTENYDVPAAYISTDYIKSLANLTGTVNNAPFRGFPAGEVLFTGASGSQEWDEEKGDGPWSLSYKFVQSPNAGLNTAANVTGPIGPTGPTDTLPALTIGSVTGIEKRGHEYLWVRYEDAVNNISNALVKRPRYVYVNPVYREEDFSGLGIGVT